jgi:hypothetical protein
VATRLVVRYALVAVAAVALAALHLRQRPATLCLLRSVTGVPCPFCGGTTATVDLAHGDLRSSLATSPIALPMLLAWPLLGVVRSPAWWRPRRVRWTAIVLVLVAAEVWQLARFGFLPG